VAILTDTPNLFGRSESEEALENDANTKQFVLSTFADEKPAHRFLVL